MITHAFQPIVDSDSQTVFAYEALLRGKDGTSPGVLFDGLNKADTHSLDRRSRVSAIGLAARLGMTQRLSVNALPWCMTEYADRVVMLLDECVRVDFDPSHLIVEVTEGEVITDMTRFAEVVTEFRQSGIQLAIDDFGAGYSGLNLLAEFQPDIIKLDMHLVRGISGRGARQTIVKAIIQVCEDLGIDVIAEGVESVDEYDWFVEHGVRLFQGFLLAVPGFECLPEPTFPRATECYGLR